MSHTTRSLLFACLWVLSPALCLAAEPTLEQVLARYDERMAPETFEAVARMVAHRDDDSERSYKMKFLKSGNDRFRVWFEEPSSVKGQEVLRQGENNWIYMPNLKRAVRLASRDSFQGGDFNNADVLRANYSQDYGGTLEADPAAPDALVADLKAKTPEASYDRVKLWFHKGDLMPLKGEFYSSSGKLLRTAEFLEVKAFGKLQRPAKVVMKNMVATKRFSTLTYESLRAPVAAPASKFVLDDLGR